MSYRGRVMVDCPKCGCPVGGVSLLVGLVKVSTHSCRCGKKWRVRTLVGSPSLHDLVEAYEDLQARYPGVKTQQTKLALDFLRVKIDVLVEEKAGRERDKRTRAADAWERKFLQAATSDGY